MAKNVIPPSPSRKDYTENETYQAQAKRNETPIFDRDEPFGLFTEWMADAREHEPNDSNAMSVATIDEHGAPDVRIVLLKEFDERGFVFYTNNQSAKGMQLTSNPVAALCLHWKSLRRQVRIRGQVEAVTEAESDAYFASRARGSQIGAWASDQSRLLKSRDALIERVAATEREYGEDQPIDRPPHWGGWRIKPDVIEFWRDRPYRLHDRLVFKKDGDRWGKERLFP